MTAGGFKGTVAACPSNSIDGKQDYELNSADKDNGKEGDENEPTLYYCKILFTALVLFATSFKDNAIDSQLPFMYRDINNNKFSEYVTAITTLEFADDLPVSKGSSKSARFHITMIFLQLCGLRLENADNPNVKAAFIDTFEIMSRNMQLEESVSIFAYGAQSNKHGITYAIICSDTERWMFVKRPKALSAKIWTQCLPVSLVPAEMPMPPAATPKPHAETSNLTTGKPTEMRKPAEMPEQHTAHGVPPSELEDIKKKLEETILRLENEVASSHKELEKSGLEDKVMKRKHQKQIDDLRSRLADNETTITELRHVFKTTRKRLKQMKVKEQDQEETYFVLDHLYNKAAPFEKEALRKSSNERKCLRDAAALEAAATVKQDQEIRKLNWASRYYVLPWTQMEVGAQIFVRLAFHNPDRRLRERLIKILIDSFDMPEYLEHDFMKIQCDPDPTLRYKLIQDHITGNCTFHIVQDCPGYDIYYYGQVWPGQGLVRADGGKTDGSLPACVEVHNWPPEEFVLFE